MGVVAALRVVGMGVVTHGCVAMGVVGWCVVDSRLLDLNAAVASSCEVDL